MNTYIVGHGDTPGGQNNCGKPALSANVHPRICESADAIAAGNATWVAQIWETARVKQKASGANEFLLIIDEIQKISKWSEKVKKLLG